MDQLDRLFKERRQEQAERCKNVNKFQVQSQCPMNNKPQNAALLYQYSSAYVKEIGHHVTFWHRSPLLQSAAPRNNAASGWIHQTSRRQPPCASCPQCP